jgi:hypothetical protein
MFFKAGHGTAPYLIYARRVPNAPSPDPTSFDNKQCTLFIIEIGFCRDLDCDIKFEKKTEKSSPFMAALRRHRGRDEFIAIPIGYAGTTLTMTLDHLTAAFFTLRLTVERPRARKGTTSPATDHNARTYDYNLIK